MRKGCIRVYVVALLDDPYRLPLAVLDTLSECADFIGITRDHLKHCKVPVNAAIYCTKKYIVEGVIIERM